mmetsp:Transcript_25124/g.63222  ORF Transcript_25124/g.63222 Transcript_25124/m.63222 type:complete len:340 (+) Transcript_25124:1646-2665(+)
MNGLLLQRHLRNERAHVESHGLPLLIRVRPAISGGQRGGVVGMPQSVGRVHGGTVRGLVFGVGRAEIAHPQKALRERPPGPHGEVGRQPHRRLQHAQSISEHHSPGAQLLHAGAAIATVQLLANLASRARCPVLEVHPRELAGVQTQKFDVVLQGEETREKPLAATHQRSRLIRAPQGHVHNLIEGREEGAERGQHDHGGEQHRARAEVVQNVRIEQKGGRIRGDAFHIQTLQLFQRLQNVLQRLRLQPVEEVSHACALHIRVRHVEIPQRHRVAEVSRNHHAAEGVRPEAPALWRISILGGKEPVRVDALRQQHTLVLGSLDNLLHRTRGCQLLRLQR